MRGTRSVGIYASTRDVTLVELTRKRGQFQLSHLTQQTIPSGVELLSSSLQQAALTQHLKESFKVKEGSHLIFSFPPEPIVLRYFKMLKIPKKEWGVAIRFEARKYLPFNMEQMNSDFVILPIEKKETEIEVVFFAIDQAQAESWSGFLNETGFVPGWTEVSWLSVLRLVKWNQQLKAKKNGKEGGILLSLEPERLGVGLFVGGTPYFSREVKWAPAIVARDSPDLLESVGGEIRLAKEFHRKNFPDQELSITYAFGSWVNQPLCQNLTQECEINTVAVDSFLRINGEKPAVVSAGIVIGIGAALRGFLNEPPETLIHLGKGEEGKKRELPVKLLLAAEGVLAFLILIGIQLYASSEIKKAQETYRLVVQSRPVVTTLTNLLTPIERLEQLQNRYQQKLTLLRSILDDRVDLTTKMSILAESLPDPMWLQKLSWKETFPDNLSQQEREIKIKGTVYSKAQKDVEAINSFIDKLRQPGFSNGLTQSELVDVQKKQLGFHEVTQFEWMGSFKELSQRKN